MKLFSLAIFLLSIPLLIKAQSRASYIAFVVMYPSLVILSKKFRKTLIFIGLIIILLTPIIFSGGIYGTLVERIKYTFSGSYGRFDIDTSGAARLITWQRLMKEKWPQKPFFGWGITGLGFIDSQYVRTIIEVGVIGTAFFLLLLYKIFTETRRIFKKTKIDWSKGIIVGFMAAHISLLFHAITTNTFIIVRIMEPFWFLLAVIMALPKLEDQYIE